MSSTNGIVKKSRGQTRRAHPVTVMLWDRGSSIKEIARKNRVCSSHVSRVCMGLNTSARVRKSIEATLGKSWAEIQAAARAKAQPQNGTS